MKSRATKRFRKCYDKLTEKIQTRARKAYALFKKNSHHPSLRFKKIYNDPEIYAVRVTQSYRALGVKKTMCLFGFGLAIMMSISEY